MVDIVTRLARVELSFTGGAFSGAQATIEEGYVDSLGQFRRTGESTTGLDAGGHPEYAATIEEALGSALTQADATLAVRTAERDQVTGERNALGQERDRLLETVADLQRRLAALIGSDDAPRS